MEGFFRPFTTLKKTGKSAGKSAEKGARQGAPSSEGAQTPKGAAQTSKPAAPSPSSKKKPGQSARSGAAAAETDGPPQLVDPETFAIYMSGVRPLQDKKPSRIPTTASRLEKAAPGAAPKTDPDAPARAQLRSLVTEGLRFETMDDGERLEGRRITVDPREIRRLRKGMYAVDGKLDLHGMSLEEAREAVTAFVKRRQSEGDHVISIIHGRGSHSPRGIGVLRGKSGPG